MADTIGRLPGQPASQGELELTRLRQESEERYRTLYEHIPLMYFTVSREGLVLRVNTTGARELGYQAHELIGEPVTSVFHPDDQDTARAQFSACIANTGKVTKWDLRKLRKDGSVMWVRETAVAVNDGDELVVLVVCEDYTERKLVEEHLIDSQQKIQALALNASMAEERERKRIAAGIHDDVGQYLALAKRRLDSLQQLDPIADADVYATEFRGVKDQIGMAIDSIRSLTFELSSPVLYVLGLEAAIKDQGERLVVRNGGEFVFRTDGQPKLLSEVATLVIFRATRELLLNCVKHAAAGKVEAEVVRVDGKIQVSVTDNGVGMTPELLDDDQESPVGFGLHNARQQLADVGGELRTEAVVPSGLRVVLTAPLNPSETPE